MARCAATDEVYDFGGIFIDIGGGTTDIALIRNGGIEGTRMFPIGGRGLNKKLADPLGLSFTEEAGGKPRRSKGGAPAGEAQQGQALPAPDGAGPRGGGGGLDL